MKNINLLAIFFSLIFFSFGCQKEYVEPKPLVNIVPASLSAKDPNRACTDYYYYYYKQKLPLGNVANSKIIIGFPEGYTTDQKNTFISKFDYFTGIESEGSTGSADVTIVRLKEGYSCSQVEALLNYLKQFPEVQYATPFFLTGDGNFKGISNQFIVNLKTTSTRADLEVLANKTKTTIVDQLSDVTYILSADKTSQGNALEMANYFNQHNKVDSSEPDFYYLFSSSYVIND